jgi:predicted nucleic acid-binding protein
MSAVLVDTGPLVAYFDRRAEHHAWVVEQFKQLHEPLLTCEAVISEALFLLKRGGLDPDWALALVERGALRCDFSLPAEVVGLRARLRQYHALPATLADVCLVRMSEIHRESIVFTLDRDFLVYRRNGRQRIPLLAPFVP